MRSSVDKSERAFKWITGTVRKNNNGFRAGSNVGLCPKAKKERDFREQTISQEGKLRTEIYNTIKKMICDSKTDEEIMEALKEKLETLRQTSKSSVINENTIRNWIADQRKKVQPIKRKINDSKNGRELS